MKIGTLNKENIIPEYQKMWQPKQIVPNQKPERLMAYDKVAEFLFSVHDIL